MALQASAYCGFVLWLSRVHFCLRYGSGVDLSSQILLADLGYPQTAPTRVLANNETCIAWSEGSVGGSELAKHIDLRFHFVHKARAAGHLELCKLHSKLNAADILTKVSTPPDVFSDLRRRIMGH